MSKPAKVGKFLRTRALVIPGATIPAAAAHKTYVAWAEGQGKAALSYEEFTQALRERGVKVRYHGDRMVFRASYERGEAVMGYLLRSPEGEAPSVAERMHAFITAHMEPGQLAVERKRAWNAYVEWAEANHVSPGVPSLFRAVLQGCGYRVERAVYAHLDGGGVARNSIVIHGAAWVD